jgi:hypothetical protein
MVQGMNTLEKQPRRLLWGAKEIAAAVFGASAKEHWHSIYNLRDELPIFEMGNVLCAWDNEIEAVMAAKTADALAPSGALTMKYFITDRAPCASVSLLVTNFLH